MCGLRKWLTKRINDLEEDNELGKVIKGPWKETPIKQIDEIAIDLEIKRAFAENLTQELIVHMIQMCHNHEIVVDNEKFIQDIGIIIEFTRGLIYRVMLMDYPTHDIVDTFVNVVYDDDGKKHTEVDMEQLRETIESLHKDEE